MRRKIIIFVLSVFFAAILAGIYGVVHDLITYSISPEYFTKFKFEQFGLWDGGKDNVKVVFVGIMATWWFGAIIGFFQSLFGLILQPNNNKRMLGSISRAILLNLALTIIIGFIGFLVGRFYLSNQNINWSFPLGLIDVKSFITVGTIHNFGYIGGVVGLVVGIIYQVRLKKR